MRIYRAGSKTCKRGDVHSFFVLGLLRRWASWSRWAGEAAGVWHWEALCVCPGCFHEVWEVWWGMGRAGVWDHSVVKPREGRRLPFCLMWVCGGAVVAVRAAAMTGGWGGFVINTREAIALLLFCFFVQIWDSALSQYLMNFPQCLRDVINVCQMFHFSASLLAPTQMQRYLALPGGCTGTGYGSSPCIVPGVVQVS